MSSVRKNKPPAPSLSLAEGIDKVRRIYEKEGKSTVPSESVADAIGYANARSGSAITTIASLKMFGLLNSPQPGHLAVDQNFEEFEYSPDDSHKREILIGWLKSPKIYSDLLHRFEEKMPSDTTLQYELIKMGFTGKSLKKFIESFKESINFSGYYNYGPEQTARYDGISNVAFDITKSKKVPGPNVVEELPAGVDRIPIRLTGGRRAWLELPIPFYESDKNILIRQIEIIVADEKEPDTTEEPIDSGV